MCRIGKYINDFPFLTYVLPLLIPQNTLTYLYQYIFTDTSLLLSASPKPKGLATEEVSISPYLSITSLLVHGLPLCMCLFDSCSP